MMAGMEVLFLEAGGTAARNTGLGSGGGACGMVLGSTGPKVSGWALAGACVHPPLSTSLVALGGLSGDVAE